MPLVSRKATTIIGLTLGTLSAAAGLLGCGANKRVASTASTTATTTSTTTTTSALPGTGRPPVTIGDKNFTEQFVLGELYSQALQAQGFTVTLNRNIGPAEVTIPALESGRLGMYPEYLDVWNTAIA